MRLVVWLVLGVCVSAIAPAVAESAPTPGEQLFQGAWRMHSFESDSDLGTLRIDDREFHAEGVNGRYKGRVSIRSEASPAQIDFTIESCGCKYEGMTSTGIYYEDEGTLVFAGPAPGDPRPEAFDGLDYLIRLRPTDAAAAEADGGTWLPAPGR